MTPKLHYPITLLLAIVLMACSPEDNSNITPEDTNEFIYNGVTYPLRSAIITDENTATNDPSNISLRLFNKTSTEITGNGDLDDIDFVNFKVVDVNLQATTYNSIDNYAISTNGFIVNSEFNSGTILLSSDDPESDVFAQSGSVRITNFTPFNIVFTFTFTRNDGEVITGSYDGNYLVSNN